MPNVSVPFEVDATATLECPCCGSSYLHHAAVHVFSRLEEDSPRGLHATITEGAAIHTDTNLRHNPSRRRDGLRIEFWCEECDAKPWLDVAQHKGVTQLCWANGSELQGMKA